MQGKFERCIVREWVLTSFLRGATGQPIESLHAALRCVRPSHAQLMAMRGRGFVTGTPGFGARRQAAMALAVLADREAEGLDRPTDRPAGRRQERASVDSERRWPVWELELGKEEERG